MVNRNFGWTQALGESHKLTVLRSKQIPRRITKNKTGPRPIVMKWLKSKWWENWKCNQKLQYTTYKKKIKLTIAFYQKPWRQETERNIKKCELGRNNTTQNIQSNQNSLSYINKMSFINESIIKILSG